MIVYGLACDVRVTLVQVPTRMFIFCVGAHSAIVGCTCMEPHKIASTIIDHFVCNSRILEVLLFIKHEVS